MNISLNEELEQVNHDLQLIDDKLEQVAQELNIFKVSTDDNMIKLLTKIDTELKYIKREIIYGEINEDLADAIYIKWLREILGNTELEFNKDLGVVENFTLTAEQGIALRNLRYGVVNNKLINAKIEYNNIETTIKQRIEYGGYIDRDDGISLEKSGTDGTIEGFIYEKNKINYHTHPSQVDKWTFNPPSEADLMLTIRESLEKDTRVVSLVAAAEGIYIYYLSQEFFLKLKELSLTEEVKGKLNDNFNDLKLLLGYVESSISVVRQPVLGNKRRGRRSHHLESPPKKEKGNNLVGNRLFEESESESESELEGGMSPERSERGMSPKRSERRNPGFTYMPQKISILKFLEIVNKMGIVMKLYPYGSEVNLPLPVIVGKGGSKIYKIKYNRH